MATLVIPNTFVDGTTMKSAELNANFNAIATFINTTKLTDDNFQANTMLLKYSIYELNPHI